MGACLASATLLGAAFGSGGIHGRPQCLPETEYLLLRRLWSLFGDEQPFETVKVARLEKIELERELAT